MRVLRLPAMLLSIPLVLCGFTGVSAQTAERERRHADQLPPISRSSVSSVSVREFGPSATGAAPDILLSEAIGPARFRQEHPTVAALPNGNLLVAWQDERLGCDKIFLQVINQAGVAIGANQVIAETPLGGELAEPRLDIDTLGRVCLFYRDAYAGPFGADLYPNGRMVITWENYALSGQNIQFKIFGADGSSVHGPVNVPSDFPGVQRWEPDVAVQPSGDILIAWEDYRNSNADIYARQFAGDGNPVSSDFGLVPAGPAAQDQYQPAVEYKAGFGFVVAWVDRRTEQDIYIQQFSPVGGLVGANRLVSVPTAGSESWDVDLAASRLSELSVTWSSSGSQNAILRRRYSSSLAEIGGVSTLSLQPLQTRWQPALTYLGATEFAAAWTEALDGEPDIAMMLFDTSGVRLLADEPIINDDPAGAPATATAIAALPGGTAHIAFTDLRSDDGDLFGQYVSLINGKEGTNTRINQDPGITLQSDPGLARRDDQLAIVWSDSRIGGGLTDHAVYGRFSSVRYQTYGTEFQISDPAQTDIKSNPAAAFSSSGELLVAWQDFRTASPTLMARWVSSAGAPIGSEISVAASGNIVAGDPVYMGTDNSGKTWVLWSAPDNGNIMLRAQAYDVAHAGAGSFAWSPNLAGVTMTDLSADVAADGSITVIWIGQAIDGKRVYLSILNSAGTEIVVTRQVSEFQSFEPESPRISIDELGFRIVGWIDHRTGLPRPYFQVLNAALAPVGGNQPVTVTSAECAFGYQLDTYRGKVWFSWIDSRLDGNQAYATVYIYEPTDVDEPGSPLPGSFALHQNYPNPFNPSTTIRFDLPNRTHVTLEILDILGRSVTVLADREYTAGSHQTNWDGRASDGTPVASGVYLYRLTTPSAVESRKMLLVK